MTDWPPQDDADDASVPLRGLNKAQLVAATGLTLNQISKLTGDGMPGVAPKSRGGEWSFDLAPVVQWLRDQSTDSIDDARRANLQATARKRAVEADKIEGKLVEIELAERVLADAAEKFRAEVLEAATCPKCRERIQGAVNRLAAVTL